MLFSICNNDKAKRFGDLIIQIDNSDKSMEGKDETNVDVITFQQCKILNKHKNNVKKKKKND